MTEDELVKEIKHQTEVACAYENQLCPIVSQMFEDQKIIFLRSVTRPANLKSTDKHSVRFTSGKYQYSLSYSHGHLRIVRTDPSTEKQEILLGWSDGGIVNFVRGEWPEDIAKFAAVLHEVLEPERLRENRERQLRHQKELHLKAQALGIPSPYNFPESPQPVLPSPKQPTKPAKLLKPEEIYKIVLVLIVIVFVVYFIARMY